MDDKTERRWRTKTSVDAPWVVLPGEYTTARIWEMKQRGDFLVAVPVDDDDNTDWISHIWSQLYGSECLHTVKPAINQRLLLT
jgi:hypothetical protein